ncbi:hypothetical protein [Methylomicrobium lacus]|uniref:hypothetical protein n=1 Tax=Methylomicrobium lacus TaxID=136992 RepID=UPI0035A8E017
MNTTALNYIPILDNETTTIGQLLSQSARSSFLICMHSALIYFESRKFLKELKLEMQTSRELIDENHQLVEKLASIQEKIKGLYHQLGGGMVLNRFLLKRAFYHFGLIIVNINEHDVDMDQTPPSGPFNSVEDLMRHLHS